MTVYRRRPVTPRRAVPLQRCVVPQRAACRGDDQTLTTLSELSLILVYTCVLAIKSCEISSEWNVNLGVPIYTLDNREFKPIFIALILAEIRRSEGP